RLRPPTTREISHKSLTLMPPNLVTSALTVADWFAETLAAACARRIYGIVGDSLDRTDGCGAPSAPISLPPVLSARKRRAHRAGELVASRGDRTDQSWSAASRISYRSSQSRTRPKQASSFNVIASLI